MLSLYREALRIRRTERRSGRVRCSWLEAGEGVLAFARGDDFACVVNLSDVRSSCPLTRLF
jgi:alpha-glucosidase